MATINLLPWRDEFRQEKTREFVTVLIMLLILASLMGYAWYAFMNDEIAFQRSRNALLQSEISVLDAKVAEIQQLKKQRKELESKMEVIQDLQNKRPLIVYYFNELVKAVPDGIHLSSLKRQGESFNIRGESTSNNRVSTFMRNLDRSPYFSSPDLKSVVKEGFILDFRTEAPSDKQAGGR